MQTNIALWLMVMVLAASAEETIRLEPQPEELPTVSEEEQFAQDSRNIFYSCIVVSRYYLSAADGVEAQLIEIAAPYKSITPDEVRAKTELKVWKRILLDAIKHCANRQTPLGSAQLYQQLHQPDFSMSSHFDLMEGYDLSVFKNQQANLEFDEFENTLWKMINEFESKVQKNNKQLFDEEDDEADVIMQDYSGDYSEYEPKVFGQSFTQQRGASITILVVVFGIVAIVMILAYKVLSNQEDPLANKKNKKSNKQKL